MENENPEIEAQVEQKLKDKNRFDQLSEKVILTSKERDEAQAKLKAESEAKLATEKERDFYREFSKNVSKYPSAAEYQDKILEKVKLGYTPEDAMLSVLAKEGKLSSNPVQQPSGQVEGGSALNNMEGTKSIQDMTSAEKLAALGEADKTGDLVRALRG